MRKSLSDRQCGETVHIRKVSAVRRGLQPFWKQFIVANKPAILSSAKRWR